MRLRDACSPQRLQRLAGEPSYTRGEDYAAEARVERLSAGDDVATATVVGTAPYRVELRVDAGGRLQGRCSCPVGEDGAFCKHCVAVGLAVRGRASAGSDGLRAYLAGRSHDELVEIVLNAAARDPTLRDSLELEAAAETGDPVEALSAAIDDAAYVDGFVRWDEAWAYAERLDAVLDALERRFRAGRAGDVVVLAERFLAAVWSQLGNVDDNAGAVATSLARAEALHLAACRESHPDPAALAERLFAMEAVDERLEDALPKYADVLGDAGRARYAELAEAAWAEADGRPSFALSRIMEHLAAGDVDRLVAIKARRLEHTWDYLEIATLLRDAGRLDDAIAWAERGLRRDVDARLREFLADCHREAGRPDLALEQRAARFAEHPTLAAYQALRTEAEPLGRWVEHRAAAWRALERRRHPFDNSVRVAILLWEGDVSGAWEQAHAGGCSRDLWRALARARVAARPADAVEAYRRLVSASIDLRNDSGYDAAVELLAELPALLAAHGREEAHAGLVAEVRQAHRRKTNLIKRLDAHGWMSTTQSG